MFETMKELVKSRRISRSPDRQVLLKNVFLNLLNQTDHLALGRNVLWVGCRHYTKDYYAIIERQGAIVSTLDIDPRAKRYGRVNSHVVGSLTDLDALYPAAKFDLIFCNGVIGWGVDSAEDQAKAYAGMRRAMKPDGLLVMGWNTHKTPDPVHHGRILDHFAQADIPGFGARMVVPFTTHVFDILRPCRAS